MKIAKIGTVVYAVHKSYVDNQKLNNATIIPCRIRTYMRDEGKIFPVLRTVGSKSDLIKGFHYVYDTLDDAVKAITPKKSGIGKKRSTGK